MCGHNYEDSLRRSTVDTLLDYYLAAYDYMRDATSEDMAKKWETYLNLIKKEIIERAELKV